MFDKRKCKRCKYHTKVVGGNIACSYFSIKNVTCLRKQPDGEVIDTRGTDPKHCLLYEPGENRAALRLY